MSVWRKRWASGLTGSAIAIAALSFASPAWAVYQCGGEKDDCQCGANNPFPCCDNGGNCTWWAWEAACCHWGVAVPMLHNAKTWAAAAASSPEYKVLNKPVVNSIACRDIGTYGHVAWVIKVSGSTVTVTEENCCSGCSAGMRQHTYDASYFTGGFIVRANQSCACKAGDTDTRGCEKCGHETRTCKDGCNWDSWGSCQGQKECEKGVAQKDKCGTCGTHERTCSSSCAWGAWSDCQGPDPEGGTQSCDTGSQGVCAVGVNRCVDGEISCVGTNKASQEICNALDDDCDGETDEDNVCKGNPPPPPPRQDASADGAPFEPWGTSDSGASGADGGTVPGKRLSTLDDKSSGCACRVSGARDPRDQGPWSWVVFAGAIAAWFGRRKHGVGHHHITY